MTDATILIIEGKHADRPSFATPLQKKGYAVFLATSGSKALEKYDDVGPDLVIVNAASMRSSGVRICKSFKEHKPKLPVLLLIDADKQVDDGAADVILTLPFTVQKIVNRIKPLLPGESSNTVQVGPIKLDVDNQRVRCLGKNTRLTPRLLTLLKVLMDKHGQVIERETLFKQVWDTDYTGDTRTLDVHISWLRNALELNPKKPTLLKTIRGVGYRLDA